MSPKLRFLRRTLVAIGALASSAAALAILGQPGTLDATWGSASPLGAGKVATSFGTVDDRATAIVLLPDGKLLITGHCNNGANDDFCALRYLANGTLDINFGGGGKTITSVTSGDDVATSAALQTDGKVLMAGGCSRNFCALRYLSDGTLDTSFGIGGKVVTPVGAGIDKASAILLQPDGRILLTGGCTTDFCALRYLSNGALDTSFGIGGKVITPMDVGINFARTSALQPDGKVLLAGYCGTNFCALRYLANGTLDANFGIGGKVITPVSGVFSGASAIALQPDGGVVLAGDCQYGIDNDICVLRYLADGSLDASFGNFGKLTTPVAARDDFVGGAVLQPDGRIILAGQCYDRISYSFCALRYLSNGTLDSSFGSGGTTITQVVSGFSFATAIAIQPDGKVLLAGQCLNGGKSDFCAIRYDGGPFGYQNCKPDLDGDGVFLATTDALIYTRVALGITGNAVIGGITFAPNATRNTWPLIRDYLVTQCGMSLVQ